MAGIVNVFKESMDIAKKNYLKLLGLYVLILIAYAILGVIVLFSVFGAALGAVPSLSFIPVLIIISIIALLISPIFYGMYYSLAIQGMQKNSNTDLGKAFDDSKRVYRKILWTAIIQAVVIVIVLGIIIGVSIVSLGGVQQAISSIYGSPGVSNSGSSILPLVITAIVVFVVSVILGDLFFIAVPLAMLDGSSGITAVKKSFGVARKYFWSIIGLLILSIIAYIIVYVITLIFSVIFSLVNPVLGSIVSLILTVLLDSFVAGVVIFLPVVFYKRFVKS